MKSRLILFLAIIVLFPSFLFGWLINHQYQKQKIRQESILRELVKSRLDDIDVHLQNALLARQQKLGLVLSRPDFLQSEEEYSSVDDRRFAISKDGKWLTTTDTNNTASSNNDKLLSQLRSHLGDYTLLFSHSYSLVEPEYYDGLWKTINIPLRQGWYQFELNGNQQYVFWIETRSKEIRGAIIDSRKLKEYLSSELNHYNPHNADNEILTIKDKSGMPIFHRGLKNSASPYEIQDQAYLSPPLQHWLANYTIQEDFWTHYYNKYQPPAFTLLFFLFLGLIAFYVYREQQLENRFVQQQMNFVNQVTHELQTPLTNIRMYSELMEEQLDEEQKDQRRFMNVISEESQRLSRLIDNILNLARGSNQSLRIQKRPGHVEDVIGKCIRIFSPGLKSNNFTIEYLRLEYPEVEFDPDALEQILNNLIGNVAKYAKEGRYLRIEHVLHWNQTIIRVMDKGPGIPLKERENIFSPFYTYSYKPGEGASGLGIGLDIARQMARLHGGDIQLIEQDKGCCFQITLETPHSGEKS